MYFFRYQSPLGEIAISANEQGITALAFQRGSAPIVEPIEKQENPELFKEVSKQLDEYFTGKRKSFDLPLAPEGTAFRQQVWQALLEIPFGETRSYGWLAKHINNPKAVRAVGGANGANPIALIIPCHRVIGSNNKLTGYAGGVEFKAALLEHENATYVQD
ncbi:methylated-DNA--[protein]-cysteine S-methyltransferase [Thalassotalea fusca]